MAVFLYLQLSGGYIGISIILFYVLSFIFLYYIIFIFPSGKRRFSVLLSGHVLLIVLTVLFSIGYFYTVSQGLPYIDRQHGISREMANSIAFTPPSFLTLLLPGISDSDFIPFGTDLTMRGLYIGLLPLLLVIVSLLRRGRFRLIVFIGSIFFLLAAAGGYTPVRGWLYSYIPLMGLFRMAAIFRFFTCVGFIVLAAYGFDDIFEKKSAPAIKVSKAIFAISGILLLLFLIVVFLIQRHMLHRPPVSSLFTFTEYLKHTTILTVAFLQGLFDLMILGLALFSFLYLWGNSNVIKYVFTCLILLDLSLAVQGNIFSTIVSTKSVANIQANINKLPRGFPIPDNAALLSHNEWNDSTLAPPIWHNAGFLRKQVTYDGNNSYNLTAYDKLADRKDFYKVLSERKFISTTPEASAYIVSFGPNQISLAVSSPIDMTVSIGQVFYRGWKIKIDNRPTLYTVAEDSTHLMKCEITRGNHLVGMYFEPAGAKLIFIYTLVVFVTGLVAVLILFGRQLIL